MVRVESLSGSSTSHHIAACVERTRWCVCVGRTPWCVCVVEGRGAVESSSSDLFTVGFCPAPSVGWKPEPASPAE